MLINNSEIDDVIPLEFFMSQNYPNPFKGKTIIKYCVPYRTRVQLTVYDPEGELIKKLVDEEKTPGTYEIEFKASACYSGESRNLKEETFFYRLEAGDYISQKKMELLV
jgi:5-hydroxyisourate hydrolase-like protein (transthyretin family)